MDGVVSQWSGPGTGSYRCGSRLVSGLFTRVQLPLGYTLVATLPPGACRINITEMHHSNNFLGKIFALNIIIECSSKFIRVRDVLEASEFGSRDDNSWWNFSLRLSSILKTRV